MGLRRRCMTRKRFVGSSAAIVAAICFVAQAGRGSALQAAGPQEQAPSGAADAAAYRELLDRYCVTCHNEKVARNGVNAELHLDQADVSNIGHSPEIWEKVIRKLRLGTMPPPGNRRPDRPVVEGFISFLKSELDRASVRNPHVARGEAFHRLNRAEYENVIRDLLAVNVDVSSLLPADDGDKT